MTSGHRPPLLSGFQRFLEQPEVVSMLAEIGKHAEGERSGTAYDSHPPLWERIAALAAATADDSSIDSRRAIELLDDVAGLELDLLAFHVRGVNVRELPPIEWNEVCEKVMLPAWERLCRQQAKALHGLRVRDLAADGAKIDSVVGKVVFAAGSDSWKAEHAFTQRLLDCALGLALSRQGWKLSTEPGGTIVARNGDEQLVPFGLMKRLEEEEGASAEWTATCARLRIEDMPLDLPA